MRLPHVFNIAFVALLAGGCSSASDNPADDGSQAQLACNEPEPEDGGTPPDYDGPVTCETAFAYMADRSACFLSMDGLRSNRWGWSIGALDSGAYTFEIYAGAGRCDLDKGTLVGWLRVEHDYAAGTRVCFHAAPGASFEETHLYVGSEPLPRDKKGNFTVAPGAYPYSHDALDGAESDCFDVDVSGYVYVVAHAVACYGEEPGADIDAGDIQK